MATTFSSAKTALDEIAARIQANRNRLSVAQATASVADSDLAAMATAYGTIVTDINTLLTDAPADAAIITLKAEKDLLVTEFQALKTTAASMKSAVDAITV